MNRRRTQLEMLACALLVAALAVQPAAGDGKRGDEGGRGKESGPAGPVGDNQVALVPAKISVKAQGKGGKGRGGGQDAGPPGGGPPGGGPLPQHAPPATPAPAPGAAAPVAPKPGAGREDGDRGRGPGPPLLTAPPEARAALPVEGYVGPRRTAPSAESARSGPSNGGATQSPSTEVPPSQPALAVPPPVAGSGPAAPAGEGRDGGALAVPDARGAPSRPRGGAGAPAADAFARPLAPGSPLAGAAPAASSAGPIAMSALEAPLVTPAAEAIMRVRADDPATTSQPRPAAGVSTLQGSADAGASDLNVAGVLVTWAKYALAGLVLLVLALLANAIVAAVRTRRLERQRELLVEDIGLLQEAMLPAVPSRIGALLATVAYRPADGPAGGDFYDAFPLPDGRVGLLLGDVSGHGRQAIAKTMLVRFTVRAHLEAGLSPREAIAISGRTLDGQLSDDFATVIAAIHDPVKGTLTYASAGHPPPIVVGPSRHRPVTVSSAPPIGVGFPTGQRQTVLPMPDGSSVMICSDGLLEARVDDVPIGPDRLAAWLAELGPGATAKDLLDRVVGEADRVSDDLAAVLLHAPPGATAPDARIEQLKLDVLDLDAPDLDGFLAAAGVGEGARLIAGRRASELLAATSGVIVEVHTGEHPIVSVVPIGDDSGIPVRPGVRAR
ncbi:MAG TPA: SpoIIE family protein phosphatase [Solirubrobacteraceae bacterium]|nr:SpoIIE family protein phosphatase [Solirubrobacteraceae bacterium]